MCDPLFSLPQFLLLDYIVPPPRLLLCYHLFSLPQLQAWHGNGTGYCFLLGPLRAKKRELIYASHVERNFTTTHFARAGRSRAATQPRTPGRALQAKASSPVRRFRLCAQLDER